MAPYSSQRVTVRFKTGRTSLAATVREVMPMLISLTPLSMTVAVGISSMRDEPAVLEYTTPRGIHRITGRLEGGGADPGTILLHRDHDEDDDIVQRRDFARVAAEVPVQITLSGPMRGAASTTTLNVSAGGLSFFDPIDMPEGARIEIDIEIEPGSARVHARGEIVRAVGADVKSVRIVEITNQDRERLVRFVFERQRIAVRIAKGG